MTCRVIDILFLVSVLASMVALVTVVVGYTVKDWVQDRRGGTEVTGPPRTTKPRIFGPISWQRAEPWSRHHAQGRVLRTVGAVSWRNHWTLIVVRPRIAQEVADDEEALQRQREAQP